MVNWGQLVMKHLSKKGKSKIIKKCTLPITGYGAADFIVTEYASFAFENGKMYLRDISDKITVEELKEITEASFEVFGEPGRF